MQCQACGDENRQEVIGRIDRPPEALDAGHTLFCCGVCGHAYGVLEAGPRKANTPTEEMFFPASLSSENSSCELSLAEPSGFHLGRPR